MTTPDVYFVSATRKGRGWIKPCRHQHLSIDDADRCAEKRSANVIVCDPLETNKAAIVAAPYLKVKQTRDRIVREAEQLINPSDPDMKVHVVKVDNGLDIRCRGKVIGEASSQSEADRWTEIRIIKTEKGAFVASTIGRSTRAGEIDFHQGLHSNDADAIVEFFRSKKERFLSRTAKQALTEAAKLEPAFADALVEEL